MNLKKIFGAILTFLGIIGLIYSAVLFVNLQDGNRDLRALLTYGIVSFIFFIAGTGLIRSLKDEK